MSPLAWLESLPSSQEVAVLVGIMSFYAAIVIVGVHALRSRHPKAFSGVSASIFSPLGAIFGLTATFLGSDVWENEAAALRAVNEEARALSQIWVLSEALGPDLSGAIKGDIRKYSQIVVEQEWPILEKMNDPYNTASLEARALLYDVLRQVSQYKVTDGIGLASFEINDLMRQVFNNRTQRIDIAIHHVSYTKLYQTLALGLLLILAVAVVHSGELRLLTVMTLGATLVVSLVVCGVIANDEPYEIGASRIDPAKFYSTHFDFVNGPGNPPVTAPPRR